MDDYIKEIRTVLITIPVGDNEGKAEISDLPSGEKIFMGAVAKPDQPGLVRLMVKRNGHTIVQPVDVSWFDGKIGTFKERVLEIPDKGGIRLELFVETTQNVATTDLIIEVVFQIWKLKC